MVTGAGTPMRPATGWPVTMNVPEPGTSTRYVPSDAVDVRLTSAPVVASVMTITAFATRRGVQEGWGERRSTGQTGPAVTVPTIVTDRWVAVGCGAGDRGGRDGDAPGVETAVGAADE